MVLASNARALKANAPVGNSPVLANKPATMALC